MNTRLSHSHPRFELGRGIVAECGVTTQPIIEHFDVLEDVPFRVVPSGVMPIVHELALECSEETFDTGVVPAIPPPRHADGHAVSGEQLLVSRGGILAPAIRVVRESRRWFPVRQRHGEGPLGQLHGQTVAHRPTNHGARVQIEDHRQIEPALRGPHVGQIPGPHLVGLLNLELPVEGVGGHRRRGGRVGRSPESRGISWGFPREERRRTFLKIPLLGDPR